MIEKQRKIFIIIFIIICIICANQVALAKTGIELMASCSNNNLKAGNNITINFEVKNLQEIGDGINAYVFTMNYDANKFEFVKAEGQNGWNSPTYNKNQISTGKMKLVATRGDFTKEANEILKITLKLKQDVTNSDIKQINFKDISFAAKIDGSTSKVEMDDMSLNSTSQNINTESKSGQNSGSKQQSNGSNKNSKSSGNSNETTSTAKNPIPKAGKITYTAIIIAFIIMIIFYKKYKNIKLFLKGEK